jgi:hypothetical protein
VSGIDEDGPRGVEAVLGKQTEEGAQDSSFEESQASLSCPNMWFLHFLHLGLDLLDGVRGDGGEVSSF